MLIAIAGIDGAGKSTLTAGIVQWLNDHGITARGVKPALFHNPAYDRYHSTLSWMKEGEAEVERQLRLALTILEICHIIHTDVIPGLNLGDVIVCDRYLEGNFIYSEARHLDTSVLKILSKHFPRADLSILLSLPPEDSLQRLSALGEHLSPEQKELLYHSSDLYTRWASNVGAITLDALRPKAELVEVVGRLIMEIYRI